MKKTANILLFLVLSFGMTACALAQQYYPPSAIYDANANQVCAGATPWIFDVDSSGTQVGSSSKQAVHGDTLVIAPRILDSYSRPRNWPTNTSFALLYQSGASMTASNMWWRDTNPSTFPAYLSSGIMDTGRVAVVFNATNDFGFSTYNCMLVAYGAAGVTSQPAKFQLNFLQGPALNSAIAPQPIYWSTLVSNIVNSAVSQAVSNVNTYTIMWTTNGALPGWYITEIVPTH